MLNENTQGGISLVSKLQNAGFEAYFVGGTVRDILLGIEPKDIDLATSAKPEEIEKIFPKNIPAGKQFGVLIVLVKNNQFQIATFREDKGHSDSRHPDEVVFSSKEFDASRRDFTINGMFFDPIAKKLYDFVNGQRDLRNGIIRFIGEAKERIREDGLRLLRAIRLRNELGFQYESNSWQAIKKSSEKINHISGERIGDELNKMLLHPNRSQALLDLKESGLLKEILPEIAVLETVDQPKKEHAEGNVWIHTWRALESLAKDTPLEVVWAILLHDSGKKPKESTKIAGQILNRLKLPNEFKDKVKWLVANHLLFLNLNKMRVAKRRGFLQYPLFPQLLRVFHADISGSLLIDYKCYDYAKKLYDQEMNRPAKEKIAQIVSGDELIRELKIKPGPEIGRLKALSQEAYLEGKITTKKEAIDYLKKSIA